ncbi:hypothetical protein PHLCEN_2v4019, partial [Hermanssonia centrifuga]
DWDAIARHSPDVQMLLLEQVKHRVQEISGIHPVYDNMCLDSCIAFTGLFAHLTQCPTCGKNCYLEDEKGK